MAGHLVARKAVGKVVETEIPTADRKGLRRVDSTAGWMAVQLADKMADWLEYRWVGWRET